MKIQAGTAMMLAMTASGWGGERIQVSVSGGNVASAVLLKAENAHMDDMNRGGLLFEREQAVRIRSVAMGLAVKPSNSGGAPRGNPEQAERLRVGIRVIDQAGASPEVMQEAMRGVSHILGQAGVEADWLDCPLGEQSPETRQLCNQRLGPSDFWLHLTIHKLPGADRDNLGAALLESSGGGVAYAYYREIETSARDWRFDTSLVLAAVMAHEIGHLLLGDAHSRTGIMSAGLTPHSLRLARQGSLLFMHAEARMIRSNLSETAISAKRGILRN